MDINYTAIVMNRVFRKHGINLYMLINSGIDYLEYWVSGPRPPNLEAALLSLLRQKNPKAPILTPFQCAALGQLKVVFCYTLDERSRYNFQKTRMFGPMSSKQIPVKTIYDQNGYGLICCGVACTEIAFEYTYRLKWSDIYAKKSSGRDKENQDTEKQSREPTLYAWRELWNRKYLAIEPREVPKVVDE